MRGLLGQQVEPQLADFPAEVAGVGLAEGVGLLGEQADQEVGAAEVPVAELLEPGPHLGLDLDRAERPGWDVVATDVHGLPWTGSRTSATSHGT